MRSVNSAAASTDNGNEQDPVENGSDVNSRRFETVSLHNNHRRRPRFCRDVWVESVEFLELKDLCRATAINRRVLGVVCQAVLDRRKPPRRVPDLIIDHRGIQVERSNSNGEKQMETLPIPEVPPPRDKILGFESVIFKLQSLFSNDSNQQILEGAGKFLSVSQERFQEHDMLLDRFERNQDFVVGKLARSVFSQLPKVRSIEADICFTGHKVLLESATFRGSTRLRFNNYAKPGLELGEEEFRNCVDWLHWPMGEGCAPRTLIFCCYKPRFIDPLGDPDSAPPPKFSVLVLFRHYNWKGCRPEPFRLEGPEERGDALCLEPITHGSDRFGRPLREIVELVDGMQDRGNFPRYRPQLGRDTYTAITVYEELSRLRQQEELVPGALIGKPGDPPPQNLCGFILRRDVAVGPYARPPLFEAQRPQIIHFDASKC